MFPEREKLQPIFRALKFRVSAFKSHTQLTVK